MALASFTWTWHLRVIATVVALPAFVAAASSVNAQSAEPSLDRVLYTTGWQQWLHSKQRVETAPVTRFEGSAYGIRQDGSLEMFGNSLRSRVDSNVFTGRVMAAFAGSRPDIFAAVDQYLVALGSVAGTTRITPIPLRQRDGSIAGTMSGRVVTRQVGDTFVNGIHLQKMRDVATVVIRDSLKWPEWSSGKARNAVQILRGTIRSRRLYNESTRLSVAIYDSVVFTGRETRTLPGGRIISDSIHLRQVRRSEFISLSASFDSAKASLLQPDNGNPESPQRWAQLADSSRREAGARLLAPHDEAAALASLQSWETMGYTRWHYRLLRRALDDPAYAMRRGFNAEGELNTLTELISSLAYYVPAFSLNQLCTQEACELIKRESTRARNPTLRTIGTIFRYAETPACYYDELLAATKRDGRFSQIRSLAKGYSQYGNGAPQLSIPSLSADWHTWYNWLRGAPPEYFKKLKRPAPIDATDTLGLNRPMAAVYLNHTAYRTGIAYRDTFNARLDRATNDTARIVYAKLIGWLAPTPADTTTSSWRRNRACQSKRLRSRS